MQTMKKWAAMAAFLFLLCACISSTRTTIEGEEPPEPGSVAQEVLLAVLEGVADAAIQTVGTEELRKRYPAAIAIFDKPGPNGEAPDGFLTLAEIKATVTAGTPEGLASRLTYLGIMAWAVSKGR